MKNVPEIYSLPLLLLTALMFSSCGESGPEPGPADKITVLDSAAVKLSMPDTLSWNGGEFGIEVSDVYYTKADTTYMPWRWTLYVDGEAVSSGEVTARTDSVCVTVPSNDTEGVRQIGLTRSFISQDTAEEVLYEGVQDTPFVKLGQFVWTKGNLSHDGDRFTVADSPADPGLYFKAGSIYGMSVENGSYTGYSYNPAKTEIAIRNIPSLDYSVDPCTILGDEYRTPVLSELEDLAKNFTGESQSGGMGGVSFGEGTLFLPFAGYLAYAGGKLNKLGSYASYWGLGSDRFGAPTVIEYDAKDLHIFTDQTVSTSASIRCVRNTRYPSAVSATGTAERLAWNAPKVTLAVDPGDFPIWHLELYGSDGSYYATSFEASKTSVNITMPDNDDTENAMTWQFYVEGFPASGEYTQNKKEHYLEVMSCLPQWNSAAAFDISIVYKSDYDFTCKAEGDDGSSFEAVASKDESIVKISVPANTGAIRHFTVWVDGSQLDGVLVTQDAEKLNIEWATPLKYSAGEFIPCATGERGAYFKFMSKEGYQDGKVYDPALVPGKTDFASVAFDGTLDPCSLVSPEGTWRTPTREELSKLMDVNNTYTEYPYGDGTLLFITVSGTNYATMNQGYLSSDGTETDWHHWYFWTRDEASDTTAWAYKYDSSPGTFVEMPKDCGLPVRCVR